MTVHPGKLSGDGAYRHQLIMPGDVRRAFAVDRPELRHLKNVIVFSTKGERDLPNM